MTSKGVHLILVEEIIERKLDNWLRNKIATDLFNDWVSNSLIDFQANKNIEICN